MRSLLSLLAGVEMFIHIVSSKASLNYRKRAYREHLKQRVLNDVNDGKRGTALGDYMQHDHTDKQVSPWHPALELTHPPSALKLEWGRGWNGGGNRHSW